MAVYISRYTVHTTLARDSVHVFTFYLNYCNLSKRFLSSILVFYILVLAGISGEISVWAAPNLAGAVKKKGAVIKCLFNPLDHIHGYIVPLFDNISQNIFTKINFFIFYIKI